MDHEEEWAKRYAEWFKDRYGADPFGFTNSVDPDKYYDADTDIVDLIWRSDIYSEDESSHLSLVYYDISKAKLTMICPDEELLSTDDMLDR